MLHHSVTVIVLYLGCLGIALAQEEEATTASPPAQLVLPLPDPNACGPEIFNHLTAHYRSCARAFHEGKDPNLDCCEGLALYYGPNSTKPSRNCFCHASVWTEFSKYEATHYYSFSTAFLHCSYRGFIVPFNAEEGVGYCYDVPPDEETLAGATAEGPPDISVRASTKEYFKKIYRDHLVSFSFATGIASGIGSLFLLWPLICDTAASIGRK